MSKYFNKAVCKLAGHFWNYKDYSNWMKENGENYDFHASRKCSCCKKQEYLYINWEAKNKISKYDIIQDSQSVGKYTFLQKL